MMTEIFQKLSEVISISSEEIRKPLTEAYNALAASVITPCIVRDDDGIQCGNHAVKLACFKSRAQNLNITLYVGLCVSHVETLVELPEQFDAKLTRFVTGDKNRCEPMRLSVDLAGDSQGASG